MISITAADSPIVAPLVRLPELPGQYIRILISVLLGFLFLTLLSQTFDFITRQTEKSNQMKTEMAKLRQCLRPVIGSNDLQYQPCEVQFLADKR